MKDQEMTGRSGFTMIEVLFTVVILSMVMAGAAILFVAIQKTCYSASLAVETSEQANKVLQRMVYGSGTNMGLREAVYSNVVVSANGSNWTVRYAALGNNRHYFVFDKTAGRISYSNNIQAGSVVVGTDIAAATVATNGDGLWVSVEVDKVSGRFMETNAQSTFIRFWN